MPAARLTKEGWFEIQRASEAGVDDDQLSQDYGVSKGAIRIRRMREGWLTPRKMAEEVAIQKAKAEVRNLSNKAAVTGVTTTPAEESIARKMLRDGETAGIHAMSVLLKKLAFAAENPETISDLETVGDISVAVKAARGIAGLDKQGQGQVVLNFGAFWNAEKTGPDDRPVFDVS